MSVKLRFGEQSPFGNLSLGLQVRAEELLGPGSTASKICGDRGALGQGKAIGTLKGGNLAERELG